MLNHHTARAKALLTRNAEKRLANDHMRRVLEQGGLSRQDYWALKVHCEEDARKYYELYYPEYPQELAAALAKRMTDLAETHQRGGLSEEYLQDGDTSAQTKWDFKKELEDEKMRGQLSLLEMKLLGEQLTKQHINN